MTLSAADERAHQPGASSWWWENWHLDVAGEDGVGLSVRLACAPALGVAWWWTHLLLPDLPGPVVVRDHEVGLPRQGLEVRADGLWGELWCETPFEHWTYGLEAFGVRLDDAADSLHGEIGERMAVGLDIEWEVDPSSPAARDHRSEDALAGYEQFGIAHGVILLGRSRFELDAAARRSHSWGQSKIDRSAGSVWMHAPDVTVSFTVREGDGADGCVLAAGADPVAVSTVRTETHRRSDALPVAARHVVNDQLEIDVEVLGSVTVPFGGPAGERAVLTRARCQYEYATGPGGRRAMGIGWSSWLDPD